MEDSCSGVWESARYEFLTAAGDDPSELPTLLLPTELTVPYPAPVGVPVVATPLMTTPTPGGKGVLETVMVGASVTRWICASAATGCGCGRLLGRLTSVGTDCNRNLPLFWL